MNNDETKKNAVENKESNSLMRKTKAQLVEIILRKDSIEKNLRAGIKSTEETLKITSANLDNIKNSYIAIKYDYNNVYDEKIFVERKLNNTIKKQKTVIWILAIIFAISIITNILCDLFYMNL